MRRSEHPERTAGPSAVAAAVTFALIVVALSGSQALAASSGEATLRPCLSDSSRARVVAAAVRAARDMLGVERTTEALLQASDHQHKPVLNTIERDLKEEALPSPLDRLGPQITNLPPPIC